MGLIITILVVLVILMIISYIYIYVEGQNENRMDNRMSINIIIWLCILGIFVFSSYRKGQINAQKGNIKFKPEIRKEYSKKTGELIKQDTVWVLIGKE